MSFLIKGWQRTKLNTGFSMWIEVLLGVPQESVFKLLLFNIYINDLFSLAKNTNVRNYVDDATFYACESDSHSLNLKLEHDSVLAIEWFEYSYMKLNQGKYHLTVSGHKHDIVWENIVCFFFYLFFLNKHTNFHC